MIKLDVRIRVETKDNGSYSAETIIDRQIHALVPPGVDPMTHLLTLLSTEGQETKNAFDRFPQFAALPSPPSQV